MLNGSSKMDIHHFLKHHPTAKQDERNEKQPEDDTVHARRGLANGSTGMFPGGLAADLARCPVFFCLPNVPK